MRVYSLAVNGKPVLEIETTCPAWLPVRPRINPMWLRSVIAHAVRQMLLRIDRS